MGDVAEDGGRYDSLISTPAEVRGTTAGRALPFITYLSFLSTKGKIVLQS